MADERAAFPDLSRRSEQLSCTKFFHPSYGLFYINFKRFKSFKDLFNYLNSTLSRIVFTDVSMTSAVDLVKLTGGSHLSVTHLIIQFN